MPFRLCVVARDSCYTTIAFMSDAVDGRSAARREVHRTTRRIVRQNVSRHFSLRSRSPSARAPLSAAGARPARLISLESHLLVLYTCLR
eukprot:2013699-Prymnesium_polylepis.1